ncbi:MAG TPA: GNAT family N-acetyltransferase [Pyrinomonadaceae bacterium]
MKISLRPCVPEDEAFLYRIYASTRLDEMAAWGWNEAQREAFLRMQFNAQQRAYEWQFPGAERSIILCDEAMAGRMIVFRNDAELRLTDITLLPEYRNTGAGKFLIRELQAQARAAGLPLRLRVAKENEGARRLYERLDFTQTGESDTHFMMEWLPAKEAEL